MRRTAASVPGRCLAPAWHTAAAVVGAVILGAGSAAAQPPATDRIAFDRPEAWAMKYFTAASSMNGLSAPEPPPAGSLAIGFESGWLPTLSTSQQQVGFEGTTPEDLNKAPVFLRPRVMFGLARGLAVTAAFDPPIRSFGVTPRLFGLAVDGPLYAASSWRLGWRAHGQVGGVTTAVTCPARVLPFPPGSPANPVGCTAESADETMLRYAGFEIVAARRTARGVAPHAAIGVNALDTAFHTNAQTYGQPDRTRLETRGIVLAASTGVGYTVNERLQIVGDLFFAPLSVRRHPGASSSIDPMVNARALVLYRVIR